jgi:hypothetical protein
MARTSSWVVPHNGCEAPTRATGAGRRRGYSRYGPVDWSSYELWARVGGHQHATADGGALTCPYAPALRSRAGVSAAAAPTAAAATPSAHVSTGVTSERTPTGLVTVAMELRVPDAMMAPPAVAALGNALLACVTDPSATAVLVHVTVAVPTQRSERETESVGVRTRRALTTVSVSVCLCVCVCCFQQEEARAAFSQDAPLPLELWSLRQGAAAVAGALAAELRLLAVMARVVARVPVTLVLDAPVTGLAVPWALQAPVCIVTERAAVRLAGSSLVGVGLGPLSVLPAHTARYLA